MSKKIVAMLMAVAMAFSLLPVTALAGNGTQTPANATQPRTSVTADTEDGVHISKKVEEAADGNYNLVMEAYVEGNTEIVASSRPLDIVLVLDVSGSMDDPMGNRDNTKRIDALKSAVNTFIDKVAEKNTSTDGTAVGHRISIVKFAGNQSTKIGNDTYEESGFLYTHTYNYSQIVKNLTIVNDAGKKELIDAVNDLQPAGATRADYGMQLAQSVLSSNQDSNRDKVVVMFTDGTPTSGEDFESSVASGAISASKALKDKDVKVYTIGIFSGANPKADVTKKKMSAENKYMHAMSSNYPDATLTSTQTGFLGSTEWHWNFGTRAQGSNYYLSAKNSTELNNVFQTISNSITTTQVKAGTSAVLQDTLTKQFVLNGADANAITVQKAEVTGKDANGKYTWGEPASVDVEKTIDGKTVSVTGFDYTSEDNVITENNGQYSGHKLIVTIPIKVNEAYEGWQAGTKNYDTNTTGDNNKAGLTGYTKDGQEASTLLNESPQIPVAAYTVTYQYSDNHEGAPPLTNYNDGKAYLPGKSITIKNAPTWTGYTFSGWKLPEGLTAGEDGSFSMPAWDVKITGSWTENEIHINYVALEGGTIQEAETETPQRYSETVKLGQANPQARGATAKPDNGKYFVGWYSNERCSNESFVSENVHYAPAITSQQDGATYYAKFSGKQTITIQVPNETLTYTGEGQTGKGYSDAETTGLPEGYTIKVTGSYKPAEGTTVSPSSTTYIGSFDEVTFKVFQGDQDVTSKFNVNAIPGKLYIKGTVTYNANANGATVTGLPQDTDRYFLNADVPVKKDGTPAREGYTFEGWTLSKEDQATTVDKGQMGETGLTFYAKWSEKKVDVKLSDLIKKELTVKKDSTLPTGTTFTVKVTPTMTGDQGTQTAITGTTTNTWENGTTDTTTGDTTYTVPFDFKTKNTLSLPAGTHTYTVQETEGDVSGMQYDSKEYTLTITVNNGSYTATYATGNATEATPTDVTPEAPLTIKNTYQAPNLSVTKQTVSVGGKAFDSNPVAHVGDTIVWKVSVKNNRTTLASTQLKDTLGGVTVYSDEERTTSVDLGTDGTWTARVPANETVTYYVTYKVKATDIPNGKIVNTIVKDGDNNTPINSDPVSTWDTKQLKSATSLSTSDWTTTVTLTLPKVNGNNEGTPVITGDGEQKPEVKPIIAISKGSYVIDQIGNEFTFMDGLSLEVGTETYTGVKDESANTYTFATKDGKTYPDTVTYDDTKTPAQFTWNINENVYAGTKVTLSYKLKLTNPNKTAGTYGVTDLNGDEKVDDTGAAVDKTKALYTNQEAKLVPKDSDENTGEELTFPKPSVSYTVSSGNSGSHSGGSRPSLNTKDHYGYIIGYPVDYYTGQPTTDQTKKPVRPEGKITRAEVATIYFRMLTDESRTKFWSQSSGYSDVKTGDWFNNAVSTLSKAGIIAGYEDGSFRPNGYITRAEFATIAARFFDVTYNGKDLFPDISGHWAKDYINQAANKGFVNGYEDGTFKPDRNITRAEAVTLVNRTLDRHPDKNHFTKDMLVWPDNMDQTKWYYADMQEATNSHTYQMKENSDKTKYENWTKTLPIRNWEALEKAWSNANSSQGNGNVV